MNPNDSLLQDNPIGGYFKRAAEVRAQADPDQVIKEMKRAIRLYEPLVKVTKMKGWTDITRVIKFQAGDDHFPSVLVSVLRGDFTRSAQLLYVPLTVECNQAQLELLRLNLGAALDFIIKFNAKEQK